MTESYTPIRREIFTSKLEQRHSAPEMEFNPLPFISKSGLRLPHRISFSKWVRIGQELSGIYSSSAWCLGDWLVYGESAFEGRYREAIAQTSLDYQTLRNYAWVARKFPLSRRRDNLTFAHHSEVTALPKPEQDFWLRKAEELTWTVKELRLRVRSSLRERCSDDDLGPGAERESRTVTLKVPLPANALEACCAAASRQGLNVDEWARQVLLAMANEEKDSHSDLFTRPDQ